MFKRERKPIDKAIDYKTTFSTVSGKKVLADLSIQARALANTFDPDPYQHAFNAGRRDMILFILHKLDYDIDEMEKRLKEAADHDKQYE